tara:strand:+ start:3263 stop:4231 length:969 start_codon:yes stop_codon:yes gene_type:complete
MENANVQDTPSNANTQDTSNAFEAPQVDATQGSSSELSVDDIILGGIDDTASAFGTPDNNVETTVESQEPIADAKNDDTRYEYWQSQAAKKDNELEQLKAQQQQMMAMQQQMMQQPQAPAQPEPEVDKFPDAPTRPSKPRNFSREEAYSDSSSESARYLDEVEDWRDNMEEYKELKHQYDMAVIQEQLSNERKARVEEVQRREAYAKQQQELANVNNMVQTKYGLNPEEAQSFIKEMSSKDSLTMDNLVQLWRIKQGQNAPMSGNVQTTPSPTFQQTKRAQQVPSPMGTMPGTGNQATGSTEDQIMDKMISDFDSRNPFKTK